MARRRATALPLLLYLLLLLQQPRGPAACYIQGVDSGQCVAGDVFAAGAPYCASTMGGAANTGYSVCTPKEYAWFPNHTLARKDQWVRDTVAYTVARREHIETGGNVPDRDAAWEGGSLPKGQYHFTQNPDCQQAYKNFICYMNFPRCDAAGVSLTICRSVCENFFNACRIASYLNRCYNPQYYGAQTEEADTLVDSNGLPIYLRYFLPGMPFTDLAYAQTPPLVGGALTPLLVVCTPSLPGGALAAAAPCAAGLALLAAVAGAAALAALRAGEN